MNKLELSFNIIESYPTEEYGENDIFVWKKGAVGDNWYKAESPFYRVVEIAHTKHDAVWYVIGEILGEKYTWY